MRERTCPNCGAVVEYNHGSMPSECPVCHNPYWNRPKEECKLFTIQQDYIESGRDKKHLMPMFEVLQFYSENIIKKKVKGKVLFSPEYLYEKAGDIALQFYELYYKYPEYEVKSSFGGILSKMALGALYSPKNKRNDELLSLDYEIDERLKMGDNPALYMADSEDRDKLLVDVYEEYEKTHSEEIVDTLLKIVTQNMMKVEREISDVDGFLYLVLLRYNLSKARKSLINEFYDYYGDSSKESVENTLRRFYDVLKGK